MAIFVQCNPILTKILPRVSQIARFFPGHIFLSLAMLFQIVFTKAIIGIFQHEIGGNNLQISENGVI